jgi:hypothetical protein
MRRKSSFLISDVDRLLKVVTRAGEKINKVEVGADGSICIVVKRPPYSCGSEKPVFEANDFDGGK